MCPTIRAQWAVIDPGAIFNASTIIYVAMACIAKTVNYFSILNIYRS
jgi:hypothetical protein